MTKEKVHEVFEAIRLHFNSPNYDFYKYHGKLRTTPKKISPLAAAIAKKVDNDERHLIYYFVANQAHYFLENGKFCGFLPEIANDKAFAIYDRFLSSLKSMESNMLSDLESIDARSETKNLANIDYVVTAFYSGKITLLTVLHVYKFANMKSKWSNTDNPLSLDFLNFVSKFEPFIALKSEIFFRVISKLVKR